MNPPSFFDADTLRALRHEHDATGSSPDLEISVSSSRLLGNQRTLTIDHEGTRYVLRATRSGKLILTK